jgi:hypothetical protein
MPSNSGLRAVDRLAGGLEVDERAAGQLETDIAAARQDVGTQEPPQLRQECAQRRLGGTREPVGPDRLEELVAPDHAATVDGEIDEEQPSLPAL